ncbi:MAG: phosphatase PAP2 family protein [Planctomycetota bacterium]
MQLEVTADRRAASPSLRAKDWVVAGYLAVEAVLVFAARENLAGWAGYLAAHAVMVALVVGLALGARASGGGLAVLLHGWYPLLYIPIIFTMLGPLVPAVNPRTYDDVLLVWDQRLFGGHPGSWFDPIATPLVTEILRACWLSYFVFPILVAVGLWRRGDRRPFAEYVFVLMLGWLLSYLGYYVVPALGPGYWPERVPAPEAVTSRGVTQTVALALFSLEWAKHDVFPSGHTMIALLVLWQAWRHRLRGWWVLVPFVAGLLVATVYLRYHYGVDVLVGIVLALGIAWVVKILAGLRPGSTSE